HILLPHHNSFPTRRSSDLPPREVETTADMAKVEKQSEEATKATTEAQQSTEATITTVKNKIICIDAGHQKSGISEQEPNGPGSRSEEHTSELQSRFDLVCR